MTFKSPEFKTQDYELIEVGVLPNNEDLKEYMRELAPEFEIFPIQYESAPDYVKEFLDIYHVDKISPLEGEDGEHMLVTFSSGPKDKPEELLILNYRKKK
jgi:hypothetical protein